MSIEAATGVRHGLVAPAVDVPLGAADPPGVHHASVAMDDRPDVSAGGGVGRTPDAAHTAAVGEAVERYVATHATLPLRRLEDLDRERAWPHVLWTGHSEEQRSQPDHPDAGAPPDTWLTCAFDLTDNLPVWVPASLVTLNPGYRTRATSSGLAAHPDPWLALVRALQELVERDAFMTTWLHQLGGRLVEQRPVDPHLGGDLRLYDLTPSFSPHPVAMATGTLGLSGRPRHSLGVACRSTWEDAAERAELELLQGLVFVAHRLARDPAMWALDRRQVTGFDEHALYYTANPADWLELPLHVDAQWAEAPVGAPAVSTHDELHQLVEALQAAGVRMAYRDLSTVDADQLGVRVVRVVSPDLTPIHHDHRWPFLGGRAGDLEWRYPDGPARRGDRTFPSPYPHPLG